MGPLKGVKILELAGIGPAPFCAMMLADMGAEVLRIERKGVRNSLDFGTLNRGRRRVALDLKDPILGQERYSPLSKRLTRSSKASVPESWNG